MARQNSITVNIDIKGDVTGSQITGVNIINHDRRSRSFGVESLVGRVFVEYLGIPSIQVLESLTSIWLAKLHGKYFEYDRVMDLWRSITNTTMKDTKELLSPTPKAIVKLHNIQITEFVSRKFGSPYQNPQHWNMSIVWAGNVLTPSYSWGNLVNTRMGTVTFLGLGDVRFVASEEGLHLLNVVSAGTSRWTEGLEGARNDHLPEYLGRFDPRSRSALDLGKQLYDFTQSILLDGRSMDQLSVGGFPIIVTDEVYSNISDQIQSFGAVALESLTGTLVQLPPSFPLIYETRIPKWCLYIGRSGQLKGIKLPEPMACSAWTVITDDNIQQEESQEKYLQWMFKVGVEDWHTQLESAVETIEVVRNKVNATVLFEFDEERNWFDPYTPFTPNTMRELLQKVRQKQYRDIVISVGDDEGNSNKGSEENVQ